MSGFVRVCWKNKAGLSGETTDYPDVAEDGLRREGEFGDYVIEFPGYRRMFIKNGLVAWVRHMAEREE